MDLMQQFKKGSTPLLILTVLEEEPMYGYQIMRELEARSQGYFSLTAASLYPMLHKLEAEHQVSSNWQDGKGKRQRKYYTITDKGKEALAEQAGQWQEFAKQLRAIIPSPPHQEAGASA